MKIVIPGGSGQVGQMLARHYLAGGHEVVILSRSRSHLPVTEKLRTVLWDANSLGDWQTEVDGADVVTRIVFSHFTESHTSSFERAVVFSGKNMRRKAAGLDLNFTYFFEQLVGLHKGMSTGKKVKKKLIG